MEVTGALEILSEKWHHANTWFGSLIFSDNSLTKRRRFSQLITKLRCTSKGILNLYYGDTFVVGAI